MSGWLHTLPLGWMTVLVFGATYLVSFLLHKCVAMLSAGAAARSFKALSPGMLPPLGIIFGLFTAFLAVTGNFPGWAFLGIFPVLAVQSAFAIGLSVSVRCSKA